MTDSRSGVEDSVESCSPGLRIVDSPLGSNDEAKSLAMVSSTVTARTEVRPPRPRRARDLRSSPVVLSRIGGLSLGTHGRRDVKMRVVQLAGPDQGDDHPYPSEFTLVQDLGLLTTAERDVVADYTLGSYLEINEALRGRRVMTDETRAKVDLLRSALSKFPLESTWRVSRETELADLGLEPGQTPESLVGEVVQELGFLSVSGLRRPPRIVEREAPVWLDLYVTAGVPALYLSEALTRASDREREMLIVDAREVYVDGVDWNPENELWVLRGLLTSEDGE